MKLSFGEAGSIHKCLKNYFQSVSSTIVLTKERGGVTLSIKELIISSECGVL